MLDEEELFLKRTQVVLKTWFKNRNQQFSLKKSENCPTLVTTHHPSALKGGVLVKS
jgi:hypothetical protein